MQDIERAAAQIFRTVGMDYIAEQEPTPLAFLEDAREKGQLLVAVVGGRIAGFIATGVLNGNLHIEELDVHPDFARRGAGRALIEFVCARARAAMSRRATLSTFVHVPWNRPYYAKLGFADLPEAEVSAEPFLTMRNREAANGHDIRKRTIMAKTL